MHLPPLQGNLTQSGYYIYTACDTNYFDSFGETLINSVRANTSLGLHVHLFNPTDTQLECCHQQQVSVTHETVNATMFDTAAKKWNSGNLSDLEKNYLDRTLNAMTKGHDRDILERMQKTYYACARFVRLAELFDQNHSVLAIDIDAVVRSQPLPMPTSRDFFVHKITGKKARILAGGMYFNPTTGSQEFLNEYAQKICKFLRNDYMYWGLDQDLLDQIVPNYNHGQLPIEYIDWNMLPGSYVWTAKGTRKELLSFVNECARYKNVQQSITVR
jgi:hypothetical protein